MLKRSKDSRRRGVKHVEASRRSPRPLPKEAKERLKASRNRLNDLFLMPSFEGVSSAKFAACRGFKNTATKSLTPPQSASYNAYH